jgi:hypothetical protein
MVPARWLRLELLEDRTVPDAGLPDVAVVAARLADPITVQFDYRTSGTPGPFQVRVYRSADAAFDPGDVAVSGPVSVSPTNTGLTQTGAVNLGSELPTDPARKYILIVADPDAVLAEQSEANNTGSFRKLVVGAVTHGFTLTGTAPAWVDGVATLLRQRGYDAAVPFKWAPLSQLPTAGATAVAGEALAARVRLAAAFSGAGPNDVVDVHLIGHSRGTAVVSLAFQSMAANPGSNAVRLGYHTQTLLDPHVARNRGTLKAGLIELEAGTGFSQVGRFSYDSSSRAARIAAFGVLAFQAAAQDPPAFVPANVDRAEVFYQTLAWNQTAPGSPDRLLGLNLVSVPPTAIPNPFGRPLFALDVGTLFGVGHYGVPLWYLAAGAPRLPLAP